MVFRIESAGVGSKVIVETDLNLSGSVAQYGRGIGLIQNIAGQLVTQFSDNLQTELARAAATDTAQPVQPSAAKPVSLFAKGCFHKVL